MKIQLQKVGDNQVRAHGPESKKWLAGIPPGQIFLHTVETPRGLNQNSLSFVWYKQIGAFTGMNPEQARCFCKWHFGVSILLSDRDKPEFREFYIKVLEPLEYEQKIKSMAFVPVTRLMSKGQFAQYMESIQVEYAKNGLILE